MTTLNPLAIAALVGGALWLGSRDSRAGASTNARTIDASGSGLKLLPAPAKQPKGTVTVGPGTQVKPGQAIVDKARADAAPLGETSQVFARPVPPAPTRSQAQAAQPIKKPGAASGNKIASQARAALPAMPAAGRVKVPAPPGTDLALAKRIANDTAAHIKNTKRAYKRAVLQRFQAAAGLRIQNADGTWAAPDGLYGPVAASALRYFGASAPAPLFKGQDLKYVPPGG